MSEKKTQIELPAQLLQGLLGGAKPADKLPDVVEVRCEGRRMVFNADAIEVALENEDPTVTHIRLRGITEWMHLDLPYEDFLKLVGAEPRRFDGEACSGD